MDARVALADLARPPGRLRMSPVDPLKHTSHCRRRDRHHAVLGRGPDKFAALKAFGKKRHAHPVMPQNLAQRSAASPKDVQIPGMHIMVQAMLNLQGQRPHAFAHVGMAHRYPYPGARGDRDHRRSDRSTAAASVGDAVADIRTTARSNSTTTAHPGGAERSGSTTSCAKPVASPSICRRQR